MNAGRRLDDVQELLTNRCAGGCQIHRREPDGMSLYHRRFVDVPADGRMQEQTLGSIRSRVSTPGLRTEIGVDLKEMIAAQRLLSVPAARQDRGELRVDDDPAIRGTMLEDDVGLHLREDVSTLAVRCPICQWSHSPVLTRHPCRLSVTS